MKKAKLIMLALLLCACTVSATAETCALELADGTLCYATNYGLMLSSPGGETKLVTDTPPKYVQRVGDTVYFVGSRYQNELNDIDLFRETLYALDAQGELRVLGQEELRFMEDEYADDDYGGLTRADRHYGYTDLCVWGDYLYYIGTEEAERGYDTLEDLRDDWDALIETRRQPLRYSYGAAVYRMPLSGGEPEKLIPNLGNAGAHLAVNNGVIAVASAYRNAIYAYDFTDFMLYDLDGKLLKTFPNEAPSRHNWLYKEDAEFTVIVNSIQTDGEQIFASLGDSEGDFASSRLVNVRDCDVTLAYEAFYVPAQLLPDGSFLYLGTDVQHEMYEDGMEQSAALKLISGETERVLAAVPQDYVCAEMYLGVAGGYAYLSTEKGLLRAPLDAENAQIELLGDAGWDVAPATAPADLLPFSNERLYTREELVRYDRNTLALMRNEILARHGYVFKKEEYKSYFGSKPWYSENPDFNYDQLNGFEMKNIELIKALEAEY